MLLLTTGYEKKKKITLFTIFVIRGRGGGVDVKFPTFVIGRRGQNQVNASKFGGGVHIFVIL